MCFMPLEDMNCETLQTPNSSNSIQSYECSLCKPGYYKTTD